MAGLSGFMRRLFGCRHRGGFYWQYDDAGRLCLACACGYLKPVGMDDDKKAARLKRLAAKSKKQSARPKQPNVVTMRRRAK